MKIGVVIVTYNRLEKLKTALDSFEKQIMKPAYILVVDNASSEPTKRFLNKWETQTSYYQRIVITKEKNTGGSGGFYTGLEKALMNEDVDWIWVSDDDAFPRIDTLKIASDFLDRAEESATINDIAAITSLVFNNNIVDKYHCRSIYTKGIMIKEHFPEKAELEAEFFEKNTLSYVGSIINKEKLQLAGLPNKDYFIYCDDTEHGIRLSKYGEIICLTKMIVDHDSVPSGDVIDWKQYYAFRNMIDMYRKHFSASCFNYFTFKVKLKIIYNHLIGGKNIKFSILETAYNDAMSGKFGIHEVYKPGWKL